MNKLPAVRRMTDEDMAPVVSLLARAFDEMRYSAAGLSFDSSSVVQTLLHPAARVLVCRDWQRLYGAAVLLVTPSPTDSGKIVGAETAWHSDPDLPPVCRFRVMLALLRGMQTVAQKEGVTSLRVNPPAGLCGRGLRRVLARLGFSVAHVAMVKAHGT